MGHKFSLILSREITNDESVILQESGCNGASFAPDKLPTNAEVSVTKIDIDDTVSPSLAEAIQAALDAAKKVPDLSVPGLVVPGLPVEKKAGEPGAVAGEVIEDESSAGNEEKVGEPSAKEPSAGEAGAKKPSTGKASAKKPSTRKASPRKPANGKAAEAAESADDAEEPSVAGAVAD